MTIPVDVDDRTTWPAQVGMIVDKWAKQYKSTTNYTGDIALPLEAEDEFRELLSGHLLRAYHCTRLLPHEVRMVGEAGLRLLSDDLISDRIDAALEAGAISADDAKELRVAHVFVTGEQRHRENKVCLILSKGKFQHDRQGCAPLLETWGGEGVYMSSKALSLPKHLKIMGKPTVVIALLNLGGRFTRHEVHPPLHKVFVGAALRLSDVSADVFYKASIPPDHVEIILQSGNPDYASLGDLPR